MSEHLAMLHKFEPGLVVAGFTFVQSDASNCGWITRWRCMDEMAAPFGVAICSQGRHALHASLVSAQPRVGQLEVRSCPTDQYSTRPLVPDAHLAVAPYVPGVGVTLSWAQLDDVDRQRAS